MAKPIPESCADLDLEAVGLELIRTSGNVSAAARALGVPRRDLRLLTDAVPELMDAALEATERALDEAEAMVLEAVRAPDKRRAIKAASFYLRARAAGRRRGFW
jgi:Bacterial regulatory protein, Fis family